MSFTYYLCPYCGVRTAKSFLGFEHRYCPACGHTFDIDETEAVTVGQSHTGEVIVLRPMTQPPAGVGPSTAKVRGGTL